MAHKDILTSSINKKRVRFNEHIRIYIIARPSEKELARAQEYRWKQFEEELSNQINVLTPNFRMNSTDDQNVAEEEKKEEEEPEEEEESEEKEEEDTNYQHADDDDYEELDPDLYRDYNEGTWGCHY